MLNRDRRTIRTTTLPVAGTTTIADSMLTANAKNVVKSIIRIVNGTKYVNHIIKVVMMFVFFFI